jgi:hypothetical protein
VHRLVFSFESATPQAELERVQDEEGIPPYPDVYFWGGDGAGVYLWYATGQFFFVTVPGGDVTRLTAPCFFNSKDLTRQVYVLGSPSPTRDIVVLTKLVGNSDGPAPFHYLLSLLDPSGSERKLLDEFDGVAVGEATNGAVLVALNPGSEPGRWQPSYAEARVYALGQDGTWVRKTVPQATDPHLRGSALTEVARKRGVPWVREEPLAGPAVWLFPVPAEVVGCNGDRLSRWGSSGECLYFLEQGLRVRLETSEASD